MTVGRIALGGDARAVTIGQGEFAIGGDPATVISTILGSCVAVVVWDPVAGVGGMNHLLLPDDAVQLADPHAASLMEQLINATQKAGAVRHRLRAKAFGGADMLGIGSRIGERNAAFVTAYLKREGIALVARSLGGTNARRVRFRPATGEAQLRVLTDMRLEEKAARPASRGDVELF